MSAAAKASGVSLVTVMMPRLRKLSLISAEPTATTTALCKDCDDLLGRAARCKQGLPGIAEDARIAALRHSRHVGEVRDAERSADRDRLDPAVAHRRGGRSHIDHRPIELAGGEIGNRLEGTALVALKGHVETGGAAERETGEVLGGTDTGRPVSDPAGMFLHVFDEVAENCRPGTRPRPASDWEFPT